VTFVRSPSSGETIGRTKERKTQITDEKNPTHGILERNDEQTIKSGLLRIGKNDSSPALSVICLDWKVIVEGKTKLKIGLKCTKIKAEIARSVEIVCSDSEL
jgi:hypothetical protein